MKTLGLFDWIKEIVLTKSDYRKFSKESWDSFEPYMIHLVLSMNPNYIELIDEVQGLNNVSKEKLYRIYASLIPRNNRTYYPYIKSKISKLSEDNIKYVSQLYECSYQEANEYIDVMPKEWLDNILDKFGLDKKEKIKKKKIKKQK